MKARHATLLVAAVALWGFGAVPAQAAKREDICKDPLLTHQEQSLCSDQMTAAQSVAEQKQIEAKFRDRITKRKPK